MAVLKAWKTVFAITETSIFKHLSNDIDIWGKGIVFIGWPGESPNKYYKIKNK
jgi:hypothetical protein